MIACEMRGYAEMRVMISSQFSVSVSVIRLVQCVEHCVLVHFCQLSPVPIQTCSQLCNNGQHDNKNQGTKNKSACCSTRARTICMHVLAACRMHHGSRGNLPLAFCRAFKTLESETIVAPATGRASSAPLTANCKHELMH